MNYKIVGSDQKEYGPVTDEQLRQWVAEGRLNRDSLIQPEGATDWKPLASFPELIPLTAPAPLSAGPAAAVSPEAALSMINGPANGLLATAVLGLLGALAGIVMNVVGVSLGGMGGAHAGDPAQRAIQMLSGGAGILSSVVHIGLSGLILYGALQMKKLLNFRLAMAAAIVALAPCVSPCCLLGLPFGIWALVVLNKPEVKSAFH